MISRSVRPGHSRDSATEPLLARDQVPREVAHYQRRDASALSDRDAALLVRMFCDL
jgi:hypothetical protein